MDFVMTTKRNFDPSTRKNIALLGSTGSIGTQTLHILESYPHLFHSSVLAAGSNVEKLIEQAKRHKPALAIIADESKYSRLAAELRPLGIETAAGSAAMTEAMERNDFQTVLTATVGYSGLEPTVRAIQNNKDIALANKETLVVAGEMINRLLSNSRSRVLPVDSEHSAIYQCLVGEDPETVRRLIITASGGPFRKFTAEQLKNVTVEDALHHPRWNMGAKITIDSATMLNKAFEIIEARWLFNISPDRIQAVVHPQSIVHSMVEFNDGAVKAQLGLPDMHLPIRYALGDATRIDTSDRPMTLADYSRLTFEAPDPDLFPCLNFAYKALEEGGTTACVINAANEIAVDAFLKGKIKFLEIYGVINETLQKSDFIVHPTHSDYINTNSQARKTATDIIDNKWKHSL